MMDFKEFTDKLEQNLKAALEDGSAHASVIRHDVEKMQGQSYTALTVSPADSNVRMNINVDSLYEQMQYGASYKKDFFESHREPLTLRRATKEAFDEYMKAHPELEELPKVKDLSSEYSEILEQKKRNYSEYKKLKRESKNWQVADSIVQMVLYDEQKEVSKNKEI